MPCKDSNLPHSEGIRSRPAAPRFFSSPAFVELFLLGLGGKESGDYNRKVSPASPTRSQAHSKSFFLCAHFSLFASLIVISSTSRFHLAHPPIHAQAHARTHTHRGTGTGLGLCRKQSVGNCLPESRLASLRELERNRVRPCPAFQGPADCGRRLSGSLRPGALGTVGARGLGGERRRQEPRQGDIWAALHGNRCLLKSFGGRPKKRSR